LGSGSARDIFEQTLERMRRWYDFYVVGYVDIHPNRRKPRLSGAPVMPEHVHLLVSEPERSKLAVVLQMLKQVSSRKLSDCARGKAFWQKRYYDFNVFYERKRVEKLRYMHRNPVKRGLVENPEDWKWSSYRHYLTGIEGVVEIESPWTARRREWLGIVPRLKRRR
jgi:putative transposase